MSLNIEKLNLIQKQTLDLTTNKLDIDPNLSKIVDNTVLNINKQEKI